MFWFGKKKKPNKKEPAQADPKKMSREEILAQAKANAAAARAEIGDETLEKIKQALLKKENSAIEQAKKKVKAMDREKVADSISDWMREKD